MTFERLPLYSAKVTPVWLLYVKNSREADLTNLTGFTL